MTKLVVLSDFDVEKLFENILGSDSCIKPISFSFFKSCTLLMNPLISAPYYTYMGFSANTEHGFCTNDIRENKLIFIYNSPAQTDWNLSRSR